MTKTTAFSELTTATHEWLAEHPGATSVHLTPSKAALPSALSAWEQANAAALPDDLRDFYLLNDGLLMRWDVVAHGREVVPLGCLNVNSVQQLTPEEKANLVGGVELTPWRLLLCALSICGALKYVRVAIMLGFSGSKHRV